MHKIPISLLIFIGSLLNASADISSPIIGILTQELRPNGLIMRHFPKKTSFIAASYVKYLEGGGARVVPIWIGRNRSYYEDIMHKINGVLLPGGSNWFNQSLGYAEAGGHIIQLAMELFQQGTYMPIWGTCLGMELLIYKLANDNEYRIDCEAKNMILPVDLKADYKSSRLFSSLSDELALVMTTENVNAHWHRFCYTEQDFQRNPSTQIWRVLSLNKDWHGTEFISTVEHIIYPFYGVQFHPEKPQYEFTKPSIPHTEAAIITSQFFANFFVNEARKCNQTFTNATEQAMRLIYNYKPEYTSIVKSIYTQQYLFSNNEIRD